MKSVSKNSNDIASLVLRLGFGFMMVFGHGLGKLESLINGGEIMFPTLLGLPPIVGLILAVFAELLAAFAVLIGFKTRLASIPIVITMAVAAFYIHLSDPLFAAVAKGGASKEFALVYLVGFLGTLLLGSGKYSVDSLIKKGK
jgi:putative oxidoreductase